MQERKTRKIKTRNPNTKQQPDKKRFDKKKSKESPSSRKSTQTKKFDRTQNPQKNNRRTSSKNRPPRRNRRQNQKKIENAKTCYMCNKPILDVCYSIQENEADNPVHLKCMIDKLKDQHNIMQNEELIYLGGNNFGIFSKNINGKDENTQLKKHISIGKNNLPISFGDFQEMLYFQSFEHKQNE